MSATAQLIAKYLIADNLPAAERVCRLELSRRSGDRTAALFGLAMVAKVLHRHGHEHLCLKSLEVPIRDEQRQYASDEAIDFSSQTLHGSLTVEARGFGFWSEAFNAIGGILLAWLMKKTPHVRWTERFLFSDDLSCNVFEHFFEPILDRGSTADADGRNIDTTAAEPHAAELDSSVVFSIADALRCSKRDVVCRRYVSPIEVLYWIIPALDIGEGEIKNHLAAALHRYCKPKAQIARAVDDYVAQTFGTAPFCAFHLRGTDKACENPNTIAAVRDIIERVSQLDHDTRLYLLSDDVELTTAMQDRFGERLSLQPFARSSGRIGIHDHRAGVAQREQLGREILIDTLVAARASRFVGSGQSNIGAAVDLIMHRSPRCHCDLVDANHLLEYRDWNAVQW